MIIDKIPKEQLNFLHHMKANHIREKALRWWKNLQDTEHPETIRMTIGKLYPGRNLNNLSKKEIEKAYIKLHNGL